jgi:hypothetical protein
LAKLLERVSAPLKKADLLTVVQVGCWTISYLAWAVDGHNSAFSGLSVSSRF